MLHFTCGFFLTSLPYSESYTLITQLRKIMSFFTINFWTNIHTIINVRCSYRQYFKLLQTQKRTHPQIHTLFILRVIYLSISESNIEQVLGQHPTKQQLQGHLPPITKTIKIRRTRHAGHCWRSRELTYRSSVSIREVPLRTCRKQWTKWGRTHKWHIPADPFTWTGKAGRTSKFYIQQLCADTGCSLEDIPGAMDDRDGWWDRIREVFACSTTWWWWWCIFEGINWIRQNIRRKR